MLGRGFACLMYHELEAPGRPLCQAEPGYTRYAVFVEGFRSQLQLLQKVGLMGVSTSEALKFDARPKAAITFDDGCESDLLYAAPLLREAGYNATFYVVAGWIGRRGFLSASQIREFSASGFEIGCHSMSHAYLTDLTRDELQHEIKDAKMALEQITGKPVEHFSCPGGRWNRQVARIAHEAGYCSVATSTPRYNSPGTDVLCLGRVGILRTMGLQDVERICRGDGMWRLRCAKYLRSFAMRLMGNAMYDRVRSRLLIAR